MMPLIGAIPVKIHDDAAARLGELGLQEEVERLIDYAQQELPEVVRIEIVLNERADPEDDSGVCVEVYGTRAFEPTDPVTRVIARWLAVNVPPTVLQHLHLCYLRGGAHAG